MQGFFKKKLIVKSSNKPKPPPVEDNKTKEPPKNKKDSFWSMKTTPVKVEVEKKDKKPEIKPSIKKP